MQPRLGRESGFLIPDTAENSAKGFVLGEAYYWAPTDWLTITPSMRYQKRERNDTDEYWVGISDPKHGVFRNGSPDVRHNPDRFILPALKIDGRSDYFPTLPNAAGVVQFSTIDGGSATVAPFTGKLTNVDVRAEHSVFTPNLYAGISDDRETTSYGYPVLSGVGFGLEEYPSFKPFDFRSFSAVETVWKFIPKIAGTPTFVVRS